MKNFLKSLLVIVAVFSFSFTAIAETTIKTDTFASINITQTKASPVAVAAVASPGDFIGVIVDVKNKNSVDVSTMNGTTEMIQSSNQTVALAKFNITADKYGNLKTESIQNLNQLSNWQRRAAIDYISPPSERTNFDKTTIDRQGKSPLKRVFGAYLARQFVTTRI